MSATLAEAGPLQLRLGLLRNGYMPLPAQGKAINAPGWTRTARTEAEVERLHRGHPGDQNTGIRCDGLCVIDIDATDPTVADLIETLALVHFGDTPLRRVGRAPKFALVFRGDPALRKASSTKFILADGSDAQVEVLRSDRHQFIAFGIHPDTGKPYTWGDATPLNTAADDLPFVTASDVAAFLAYCNEHLAKHGSPKPGTGADRDGDRRTSAQGLEASIEDVKSALAVIPPTDAYHGWIGVGLAVHGATGGSPEGYEAFDDWSGRADSYGGANQTEAKWQGFRPTETGFGTLFHLARNADSTWYPPSRDTGGAEFDPLPLLPPLPGEPDLRIATAEQQTVLRDLLSIDAWINRDIPEPDRLLGDVLTTTSRVFFVGRTGLGKTLFSMGVAAGVASGTGFLRWPSSRAARVLYLDGEMPAELIKPRAAEAVRRLPDGASIPQGNLSIFGRDIDVEARRAVPKLPRFEPLNTTAGRDFLMALIGAIGGVDLIVFDNVMSLITGDQKDELAWSDTLPLVQTLTNRRIGQVWCDHTGHNSDRQYGSSTKAWRFDAVGVMTPVAGADPKATAFKLSFDHPGKARRRTPNNWRDFEDIKVKLAGDVWTAETAAKEAPKPRAEVNPKPGAIAAYEVLRATAGLSGTTTRDGWYAACVHKGLADEIPDGATWQTKDRKLARFRAWLSNLKAASWIDVTDEAVTDLRSGALAAIL